MAPSSSRSIRHLNLLMGFNNPQQVKGILGMDSALTDIFLQVKLNGDMGLITGITKLLLEEEELHPGSVFDHDFITAHTQGYEALSHIRQHDVKNHWQPRVVFQLTSCRETANILKGRRKIICLLYFMGLTQHKNAVDTIKEIVNILLLKGSIGKPGAGTCPVRGHSNVQGDRTMGIYEKPSARFLKSLSDHFGFTAPQHHGYDTVECIHAMHEGKAKVFIAMGGNFLSATPDTLLYCRGIASVQTYGACFYKLNRSHSGTWGRGADTALFRQER